MPFISVKMGPGRPVEVKKELARRLTDSVVEVLGVDPEWVTIVFEEIDKPNWATGGKLHSSEPGTDR